MHFDKIFHNATIKFPAKVFLEPRRLGVKKAIDSFKNKDMRTNKKRSKIEGMHCDQKYSRLRMMLVGCQRFGDLFLFGLIWQYSSDHKTYNKGRFKVIATYLQQ